MTEGLDLKLYLYAGNTRPIQIVRILTSLDKLVVLKTNIPIVKGVQEKLCFFSQFTATPPYRLHRSQRNASVQSLQLAGKFLHNQ